MAAPVRIDLEAGAWMDYWPHFVADHETWLARLVGELPLAAETYRIAGRAVAAPRLVAWIGNPDAEYSYSGVRHAPAAWSPAISSIKEMIEDESGLRFNSALANYYRDGADGMGWHADAEPEVGPSPDDRWIASISLGTPRRFVVRHRRRSDDRRELALGRGALLIMRGTTQTHYRHAAPKTARAVGPRLNITFRHIRAST